MALRKRPGEKIATNIEVKRLRLDEDAEISDDQQNYDQLWEKFRE